MYMNCKLFHLRQFAKCRRVFCLVKIEFQERTKPHTKTPENNQQQMPLQNVQTALNYGYSNDFYFVNLNSKI